MSAREWVFALHVSAWVSHFLQHTTCYPLAGGDGGTEGRLIRTSPTCAFAIPLPILSYVHVAHARMVHGSRMIRHVFIDLPLSIFY